MAATSVAVAAAAAQAAAEDAVGPRLSGLDLLEDDPFDGVVFSPTLEAAIQDVMPSEDELDRWGPAPRLAASAGILALARDQTASDGRSPVLGDPPSVPICAAQR